MAESSQQPAVLRSAVGPLSPGQVRRAHVPVIVWAGTPPAWRPGLVLGWHRSGRGQWEVLLRHRYEDRADREHWVVYDRRLILPVTLAPEDLRWWLPEPLDGTDY